MNPQELRTLRLTAVIVVGIAAFLALQGKWASVGMVLGFLILFSAFVTWRGRRFTEARSEPVRDETRTRKLIARLLPCLLVFFVALTVYDSVDGDWFGVALLGGCIGASLIGSWMNRRRLEEIQR